MIPEVLKAIEALGVVTMSTRCASDRLSQILLDSWS